MSLVLFISFFWVRPLIWGLVARMWSKVASICVLTRACFFWRNWRCFRVRRTCFEGQVKLSWDVAVYYCAQQAILLRYNWYNAWWLQLRWTIRHSCMVNFSNLCEVYPPLGIQAGCKQLLQEPDIAWVQPAVGTMPGEPRAAGTFTGKLSFVTIPVWQDSAFRISWSYSPWSDPSTTQRTWSL